MAEPGSIMPILGYLVQGTLPTNAIEAWHLAHYAKAYVIVGDRLYKRSTSGILQKCIPCE
jgi:hypothetical protein